MTSRNYFQGKRIALVGLGPHGDLVEDAKFMIKMGAILSLYDIRSEARLKNHIVFLRSIGLANYVCGSIPAEDLEDMDLIILSQEYPRESSFLSGAKSRGIKIEYPETLFFRLAPPVTIIGIIGACGKSTVISMLSTLLAPMFSGKKGKGMIDSDDRNGNQSIIVIDSETDSGIISWLKKVKSGDIVILRVTDNLFNEMIDLRLSPHVAVYPSMPARNTYRESPFEILNFQTYNNFIIASDEIIDATRLYRFQPKVKMLRTKSGIVPEDWGQAAKAYNRYDAALSIQVANLFKVPEEVIEKSMISWKPPKGRVELVKKIRGVEFYNDAASTTPEATISALTTIADSGKVVLIMGGADNNHDYRELHKILPKYARMVILVPGSGTMKERRALGEIEDMTVLSAPSLEEAVRLAKENAKAGDRVLFSPAFPAGGIDMTRKERGDHFVRALRSL
ncbi:MAG: hypothetical protein M1459_01290 [Patescibacteria group bacterium]|nr:hypothetical protein [Patescibacteria group bacterium]